MLWVLLLILICILKISYQRWKNNKCTKMFERYRSTKPCWPLVGHGLMFLATDPEEQMKLCIEIGEESYLNGGLITIAIINKIYLGVTDPVIADVIFKACCDKDHLNDFLHLLIGHGSIFAPVHIWRPRRKIVAPTFSMKNLNEFVITFEEQSRILIKCLSAVENECFSIADYFTRYSLDAVCENTLGVKVQSQVNPNHDFLNAIQEVFALTVERMARPWLYNDWIYKALPVYKKYTHSRDIVQNYVAKVIETKKRTLQQPTEKNGLKTFLSLLKQSANKNNESFGDAEILEETLVIVLAGTDTSAVGASFTALMLARHPDVQEKCYKELLEIFEKTDRPVTPKDLVNLKYLDAVIKESLRLYPPAPVILRRMEKDLNLPTGDIIPEGTGIAVSVYGVHRNPAYWGADADQFRPDRFMNSKVMHPAAFLPFGFGPRSCLGYQYAMMSMKTVLANLLRHYRLLPVYPRGEPEPIRLKNDLMMRDVDNFPIRIQRRN